MRVLVGCEESQIVTIALRKRGHEAFSCDVEPCSGNHPEWHLKCDVRDVLYQPWDMGLFFPPCTDLAVSGAAWFAQKRADGRQQKSIEFFMLFTNLPHIPKTMIENPVGIMSRHYRKPDQIIQPWMFGHPLSKKTCLWLKGLPLLCPTNIVAPEYVTDRRGKRYSRLHHESVRLPPKERAKVRSLTFQGLADAIAEQWG